MCGTFVQNSGENDDVVDAIECAPGIYGTWQAVYQVNAPQDHGLNVACAPVGEFLLPDFK